MASLSSSTPTLPFNLQSGTNKLTIQGGIDTGATHTVLSEEVAKALNLIAEGQTVAWTIGGKSTLWQSSVDITYRQHKLPQVSVVVAPRLPFHLIVGLDVIAHVPSILLDAFPGLSSSVPLSDSIVKQVAEEAITKYEQKKASDYIRDVIFGDLLVGGVIGGILSYLLITFGLLLFNWSPTIGVTVYVVIVIILVACVVVRRSRHIPK